MPIDASIPLQMQAPQDPFAQYSKLAHLQNLKAQSELADLQVQGARRGQERQNKLSQLLAGEYATPDAREQALLQGGFADESLKLGKDRRENTKLQTETEATQFKTAYGKLGALQNIISAARDPASYTQALQAAQSMGLDVSQAPQQYDPAFVQNAGLQAQTAKERLEAEARKRGLDIQALAQAETGRHNRVSEGISGGNLAVAREGLGLRRQELASGKVPPGYRATAGGGLEAIPGGPADLKTNAAGVAKVSDAKDVLGLLDEVDALLPNSTGSYGGAAYDAAKGAFGGSTKGAQTAAQLKALQGALVSKMPKMSGPQSDKDVLLYREMAGQVGDQTIPVSQRQAASSMIRKLNEKYAGMPEGSSKRDGKTGDWAPPAGGVIDFGSLK